MNETSHIVRILLLENQSAHQDDIRQLIHNALSKAEVQVASLASGILDDVLSFKPHIILFEESSAGMSPLQAMQQLQNAAIDIPFIIITGEQEEARALHAVKEGAADYIIREKPARLSMAVQKAIQAHQSSTQQRMYQHLLFDTSIIIRFDVEGTITGVSQQLLSATGHIKEDYIGKSFEQIFSGTFTLKDLQTPSDDGKLWSGVMVSKMKSGEKIWLNTSLYCHRCFTESRQFVAICTDVTEQKILKLQLADHQRNEKVKVAAITLAVQEKERNTIGQELHDNVNQILVGIKLLLASLINRSEGVHEYIKLCYFNIDTAIEENRKIASVLITPDFEEHNFLKQLQMLLDSMLGIAGVRIHINTELFEEAELDKGQKLAVYRIVQEQCTNIVKYAAASNVYLTLSTAGNSFKMTIADDGMGVRSNEAKKGIGLKNIAYRIAIFNGTVNTVSAPGCGFTLQIKMPLQIRRTVAPPDITAHSN